MDVAGKEKSLQETIENLEKLLCYPKQFSVFSAHGSLVRCKPFTTSFNKLRDINYRINPTVEPSYKKCLERLKYLMSKMALNSFIGPRSHIFPLSNFSVQVSPIPKLRPPASDDNEEHDSLVPP